MDYSGGLLDLLIGFLEGKVTKEEYRLSCAAICTGLRSGVFLYSGKEYSSFIADVQESRCFAALQQQYTYLNERILTLSEKFAKAYPPETCDSIRESYYSMNNELQDTENKFKDHRDNINTLNSLREEVKKSIKDFEDTANKLSKTFFHSLNNDAANWRGRDWNKRYSDKPSVNTGRRRKFSQRRGASTE
ncbi:hypothetical protein QR46_0664 [Giardia duodenalis assemblage B]|uniref:Uncharacterized protein n=1 Tax=Giardia duodenalis assemblage B TaxID=1394984 RepID=A0A132P054_GIAIN|nr:hypothetical protein QR46_0664 [Giardia intestinalis assemblage B]